MAVLMREVLARLSGGLVNVCPLLEVCTIFKVIFAYAITGCSSSKYEQRRASTMLHNIRYIRICMGENLSFL